MLAERGLLDLDPPASKDWPEFSAQGKQEIPISYLLSHKAGLPVFPPESDIGPYGTARLDAKHGKLLPR
jgi:CubicO group peptidase (beta-lactamase class C family)